jgi:hypothetical protein
MAEKGESMMMGDPSCAWVRDWLPLLAGDGEDVPSEGGDLGVEDRLRMERHLGLCRSCRGHRAALEGALSILGAVAVETPVGPAAHSVWPGLEGRIRKHRGRDRAAWTAILRAACPRGIRSGADRLGRGWEEIRGQLPFQIAWARDSAREILEARTGMIGPVPALQQTPRVDAAFPRLALGLGVAALMCLMVVPVVQLRQTQAEAQIAAGATPLPGVRVEPIEPSEAAVLESEPKPRPVESLAQADPPPAVEVQAPVAAPAPAPAPAPGAAAKASTAAASPTARYDLEYGIPMPHDSRGVKPAY